MTERLLTARELGESLGFSAATIVDWAESKKIPCSKIGGRLRFRWSEVEPWLESCRMGRAVSTDTSPCAPPTVVASSRGGAGHRTRQSNSARREGG